MPEEAVVVEQPVVADPPQVAAPAAEPADAALAAFSNRVVGGTQPSQSAQNAPAEQSQPVATPPVEKEKPGSAPDTSFLKELGYETPEALRTRLDAVKDYDDLKNNYESAKSNQRDAHDEAVRNLLADPEKARSYFDLQTLKPEALATGTPEDQRRLLFEKYRLDNPTMSARLAELEFEDEFENRFALANSEDADENDPAKIRAKERLAHAVNQAVPVVKAAQEASRIALVPKQETANALTPEQEQAFAAEWLKSVDTVVGAGKLDQVFQTELGPVTVSYDTKDKSLRDFLDDPFRVANEFFQKVAYPNGFDKPADLSALAQAFQRLTKPEAIAAAASAVGKASVGAHVPMEKLANLPPVTPQAPGSGGGRTLEQAFAEAAARQNR